MQHGNFPNGDICDIISDHIIKYEIQHLNTYKQGPTKIYTKRVY